MASDRALADTEWTEDPRYRVSSRESAITAVFFLAYIVVTIGTAWLLGGHESAREIDLVFGFPAWLFWSTFVLGAVFCVVPYFIVRLLFTDMPLDAETDWSDSTSVKSTPSGGRW